VTQSARTSKRPPLSLLHLVGVLGLAGGLLLMLDFNRRQAEAQRLEADRDRAATDVAQLEYENDVLETQVAYATTDAAVIEWAHEQGKLVQGDEVLVVPLLPTPQPTAVPAPALAPPRPPSWVLWWNLFFDWSPPMLR